MTTTEIIIAFLKDTQGTRFIGNHVIASEVPEYGYEKFGRLFSPTTYDRKWRLLKADVKLQEQNKIKITKVETAGREDHYRINKL